MYRKSMAVKKKRRWFCCVWDNKPEIYLYRLKKRIRFVDDRKSDNSCDQGWLTKNRAIIGRDLTSGSNSRDKSHDINDPRRDNYKDLWRGNFLHKMSSTSSILNHFKRKATDHENGNSDTSPKRQKGTSRTPPTAIQPPSISLKGDFLFQIRPPGFELERSTIPGQEIRKSPDLDLVLFKPFLTNNSAKTLYKYLLTSLPWYKVLPFTAPHVSPVPFPNQ